MVRRVTVPSSLASSMSAPVSRMAATSFGKMPTTSERRSISRLSRSKEFMEAIWGQCSRGKSMQASASSREASIIFSSLGCLALKASATSPHCSTAAALLSWAKIVLSMADTAARCLAPTWARAFLAQCMRHL